MKHIIIMLFFVISSGFCEYNLNLVGAKGESFSIDDLLKRGMHVYMQWTAQY